MKTIDLYEIRNRKQPSKIIDSGSDVEWILTHQFKSQEEYIQYFTRGGKFNWLLKLWVKLNGISED